MTCFTYAVRHDVFLLYDAGECSPHMLVSEGCYLNIFMTFNAAKLVMGGDQPGEIIWLHLMAVGAKTHFFLVILAGKRLIVEEERSYNSNSKHCNKELDYSHSTPDLLSLKRLGW